MRTDFPVEQAQGLTRRGVFLAAVALPLALIARPSDAQTLSEARALIHQVVGEITTVINSGMSQDAMFREFERIFASYADVPAIARSALGPPARTAQPQQLARYTEAFRGYMARKYGRQFRSVIGGSVSVQDARELDRFLEVISIAHLPGEAPFEVRWHVSDRSGRILFFNMIIDGVNVLAVERTEIGAMLERRGGDIDRLTAALREAG